MIGNVVIGLVLSPWVWIGRTVFAAAVMPQRSTHVNPCQPLGVGTRTFSRSDYIHHADQGLENPNLATVSAAWNTGSSRLKVPLSISNTT